VVREVVAEELERRSSFEERFDLVTVTDVAVDPDLKHATIFVSRLDDEIAEALEENRRLFQSAIARQTRMKRTPLLSFRLDPSLDGGERIEAILRQLHAESDVPDAE
jgi:ribosome-binding factor A